MVQGALWGHYRHSPLTISESATAAGDDWSNFGTSRLRACRRQAGNSVLTLFLFPRSSSSTSQDFG